MTERARPSASRSPPGASAPAARASRASRARASRATSSRSSRTAGPSSSSSARRPRVSLHIPWDKPDEPGRAARVRRRSAGCIFDAMNSNTFQDQPGQKHSYKFGSLTHPDRGRARARPSSTTSSASRSAATLGRSAHTVWIGDGGNFPGPDALPPRPRALPREHARDLRRPARRLARSSSSTSSTSPPSTRP